MPKSKGRRKPNRAITPPPVHKETKVSPRWYVALMFALMAGGVLMIILNYIGVFPGGQQSIYLYSGLAAIGIGFMMTLNLY